MGVENSDSSIDVHEGLEYRLGKRALEAFINNIDKDTWDGIKDELSGIAKTFSNYNNFIGFTKFVTKTYEDISLLNSIHSKYGKETPLRSLLAEYWSKSKPGRFGSINGETLSKMVLQAEWKDNPTSRRIRKRRESRRQNIIEPQEIFSINLTENDISDQSVMNEKVGSAVVTFFGLEQENDEENSIRIRCDDSFEQQNLSENPIINSESPKSVGSVSLDFTVLGDLPGNNEAQQDISQLDDVRINSEDVIHFNGTPEQVEKWNHDLDVYFKEIDNKYGDTSVGKKLSERFYQMNLHNIELIVNSGGSINEVKSLFEKWNVEKLSLLPDGFFDENNLMIFSFGYQMLKYRDVENKDVVNKRLVDILNGKGFKAEQGKFAHEIYQNYTFSEIVREIIMRCDLNNRNDVRKVQLLAGCFTNVDNLFAVDGDGIIGPKTLGFFYKISNSDSFKLLPDNDPCKIKILGILENYSGYNFNGSIYEDFDDPSSRLREFRLNPRAYYASHGMDVSRFQYGKVDNFDSNSSNGNTDNELTFIKSNRNTLLERRISELLDQNPDNTREENAQVISNILNLMPKDECQKIVEGFLSDDKVVSTFQSLTNLPKEMIPKLIFSIFEGKKFDDEYKDARGVLLLLFHQFSGGEIGGLINQVKDQVMNQSGKAVFEARKDFLEGTLGFSVIQLPQDKSRDNVDEGYFYFRDYEHPESLYKYNAKEGNIYIIENISDNKDGVITYSAQGVERKLFDIGKYEDLVGSLDVKEILGLGGERAKTLEDLKQRIYVNVRNSIRVSKGTLDISSIRHLNEENVLQNGIVFKIGQIFNLNDKITGDSGLQGERNVKDKIQITKEDIGPSYNLISAALKSFPNMNSQELSDFSSLLDQILFVKNYLDSDNTYSGDGSEFTPLQKFIFNNRKNTEVLKGKTISDGNFGGQWDGEDIIYGAIFKTLLKKDEGIFDSEKIFVLNYSEGKMRNELALQDMIGLNYSTLISGNSKGAVANRIEASVQNDLNKDLNDLEREISELPDDSFPVG